MVDLESFHRKKWTLFTFCLFGIIIWIIVIIVLCLAIDHADVPPNKLTPQEAELWPTEKKVLKIVIIAYGVFGILLNLLGLFGAYKEHYCMTFTYAIFMSLVTLLSIGYATTGAPSAWGHFVVNLLITVKAFLFASEIKQLQRAGHYGTLWHTGYA